MADVTVLPGDLEIFSETEEDQIWELNMYLTHRTFLTCHPDYVLGGNRLSIYTSSLKLRAVQDQVMRSTIVRVEEHVDG